MVQDLTRENHYWGISMGSWFPLLIHFLAIHMVKNLAAIQETWVQSLRWKDPLEKGMAAHSSIPAWSIPWTEEPGGLQSMGSQGVRHDWATNQWQQQQHPLIHCLFLSRWSVNFDYPRAKVQINWLILGLYYWLDMILHFMLVLLVSGELETERQAQMHCG